MEVSGIRDLTVVNNKSECYRPTENNSVKRGVLTSSPGKWILCRIAWRIRRQCLARAIRNTISTRPRPWTAAGERYRRCFRTASETDFREDTCIGYGRVRLFLPL